MVPRSATIFPEGLDLRIDRRLADHASLEENQFEAERLLTALSWKSASDAGYPLIVCVIGGTGTGKSTLFNSLAGTIISKVGIRRPSTLKPVISVHEDFVKHIAECPFIGPYHQDPEVGDNYAEIRILPHNQAESASLILVDSPDFDSVELSNRIIADNFFVLSDIMLFVTSQEKYGDLVGHQVLERALSWGKHTLVVMNKVTSDYAFRDFRDMLQVSLGRMGDPIRIERFTPSPEIIPGLRDRPEFSRLFTMGPGCPAGESIRREELGKLRARTASNLEDLRYMLDARLRRVESVNFQIRLALSRVSLAMEKRLDAVLSDDIERRLRDRLRNLLNKYDIFSAPRMMVRRAIRKALGMVAGLFSPQSGRANFEDRDKEVRIEDFETTRSAAKLKPLEWAVARLDLEIAEILSSDSSLEDLRSVAKNDIPRWGSSEIRSLFDEAFPGVENLLENEFERLRQGLSRADEVKLYGSYTLWALLLITAEIVMGGGFTLLDALLSTVVVPFIPKWLLSLKVLDLLRDIGERVDQEYRSILQSILEKRADLYTSEFRGLLPDEETLNRLKSLRMRLGEDA